MSRLLKSRKGQTSLEYLLLLSATFIAAYIMARGPVGKFTKEMFANIFSGIQNLITYAEWSGEEITPGKGNHPMDPARTKPLHL